MNNDLSDDFAMPDISKIGEIDESQIQLTEEDMNDPELMAELSKINGDDEDSRDISHRQNFKSTLQINDKDGYDSDDNRLLAEFHKEMNQSSQQNDIINLIEFDGKPKQSTSVKKNSTKESIELKNQALALKKEGDISGAMELLKKAKMLENGYTIDSKIESIKSIAKQDNSDHTNKASNVPLKQQYNTSSPLNINAKQNSSVPLQNPHTASSAGVGTQMSQSMSQPSVTKYDVFAPLEQAITEAMKPLLLQAKALKQSNPALAQSKWQAYKQLKSDMDILESRRNTLGALAVGPPPFQWIVNTKSTEIVDNTLGDDQVKIVIESIGNLSERLKGISGTSLSLTIDSPFVKDVPPVTTKKYAIKDHQCVTNFEIMHNFKRGISGTTIFTRRKLQVEIIHHKGFFSGQESLGFVKISLDGLLSKCEVHSELPITDSGGRKGMGGTLTVSMKVRRPITTPEVRTEVDRELVVGPWPEVQVQVQVIQSAPLAASASSAVTLPAKVVSGSSHESYEVESYFGDTLHGDAHAERITDVKPSSTVSVSNNESSTSEIAVKLTSQSEEGKKVTDFSSLSDMEKSDPLSVNLFCSNDVMDAEIAAIETQLVKAISEEEKADLQMRHALISARLNILIEHVQSNKLSLDDYLHNIEIRITQDKLLAVYCNTHNMKTEALSVMKRVKIMQKEVESASEIEK